MYNYTNEDIEEFKIKDADGDELCISPNYYTDGYKTQNDDIFCVSISDDFGLTVSQAQEVIDYLTNVLKYISTPIKGDIVCVKSGVFKNFSGIVQKTSTEDEVCVEISGNDEHSTFELYEPIENLEIIKGE